jgi:hypothetical protein
MRTPSVTEHYSRGAEPSPRKLEDVCGEDADQALREVAELCQRWDNRITIKNLAFAERYLEAEMEFGLVLETISSPASVSHQFVAVFKRKLPVDGPRHMPIWRRQMVHAGTDQIMSESEIPLSGCDRDEQQVFVGDVDTVQTVEGIVPSRVRLEALDKFYRGCACLVDSLDGTRSKMGVARTYWERSIIVGRSPFSRTKALARRSRAERKLWIQSPTTAPHSTGIASRSLKR